MKVSRKELTWAAGFFDGEGCLHINNQSHQRRVPVLSIGQTDTEPLLRFKAAVLDIGVIYGPRHMIGRQPLYQYVANGYERSQAVFAMLWFELCSRKREQGREVFAEALPYERARYEATLNPTCVHGHPMVGDNLYTYGNNRVMCNICRVGRNRFRREQRRASEQLISALFKGELS